MISKKKRFEEPIRSSFNFLSNNDGGIQNLTIALNSGQLKYLDRLWLEGNKIDNFPEALPLAAELDDLRIGQNG